MAPGWVTCFLCEWVGVYDVSYRVCAHDGSSYSSLPGSSWGSWTGRDSSSCFWGAEVSLHDLVCCALGFGFVLGGGGCFQFVPMNAAHGSLAQS